MAEAGDDDKPPQGVIVAVRVRPLWVKGREKGCTSVVRMENNTTILHPDPEDPEAEPRKYAFDYSYWSSDRCIQDEEGIWRPDGPDSPYADQDKVWSDIGNIILRNTLRGYNCTVFAYGQSGAGKSYSVVGYSPNVGIVPRATREVFQIVDSNTDPDVKYEVDIAMIEVYMEKIYDLLAPDQSNRQELKVFINRGDVYIYSPKARKNRDIIYRACKNAEQAETFRLQGDKNRTVRATGMNPTSSRAHTLFVLRLRKMTKNGDDWIEEFRSKINLVDLAGSERPQDTGLSGIGLEEGVAINSSLSALGRVMVQLVEGKRVNYRASRLTEVLAESLNGRAVTCMIAALSPADINYGDTLSTLRFADNAKKMPVKVEKKLSPTQQLIEDLRKENESLKKRLGLGDGDDAGVSAEEADAEAQIVAEEARATAEKLQAEADALRLELEQARAELVAEEADDLEYQKKIRELQDKLAEANDAHADAEKAEEAASQHPERLKERQEAVEAILEEQNHSFESRLEASEQLEHQIKQAMADSCLTVREIVGVFGAGGDLSNAPYLVNLVADPSATLVVMLKQDLPVVNAASNTHSGRGLQLSGKTIKAHHATFRVVDNKVTLEPHSKAKMFLNGAELVKARELTHSDRIVFGVEHAFLFVDARGKPSQVLQTPTGPVVTDLEVVKKLEAQVAAYEKELAKLRRGSAAGGTSSGSCGPGAGNEYGGIVPSAPGKNNESAQDMAGRIMANSNGKNGDASGGGRVLNEVQELQNQLAQTRQSLEVLHSLNGVAEGEQGNLIEKLALSVQRGDLASKQERTEILHQLQELKVQLDAVVVEQKKCCRCQCSIA